ncbi:MAG: hypothetical protein DLM50_09750 [Candidatus Meridianibacter frigidus]|nr:MAG: hypothetical protein DLM50_09750 [Candidatus Eremiobacteraeota bacterium]
MLAVMVALASAAIPLLSLAGATRKRLDALSDHPLVTAARDGQREVSRLNGAAAELADQAQAMQSAVGALRQPLRASPFSSVAAETVRIRSAFRELIEVLR